MFIKLVAYNGKPYLVNTAHLVDVIENTEDGNSDLSLSDGSSAIVKETVEEIEKLLNPPNATLESLKGFDLHEIMDKAFKMGK